MTKTQDIPMGEPNYRNDFLGWFNDIMRNPKRIRTEIGNHRESVTALFILGCLFTNEQRARVRRVNSQISDVDEESQLVNLIGDVNFDIFTSSEINGVVSLYSSPYLFADCCLFLMLFFIFISVVLI